MKYHQEHFLWNCKACCGKTPKRGDLQNCNYWWGITLGKFSVKFFWWWLRLLLTANWGKSKQGLGNVENVLNKSSFTNVLALLSLTSLTSRRHSTVCTGQPCGSFWIHMEFQEILSTWERDSMTILNTASSWIIIRSLSGSQWSPEWGRGVSSRPSSS